MKKIRWIAAMLLVMLLFTACSSAKRAETPLMESNVKMDSTAAIQAKGANGYTGNMTVTEEMKVAEEQVSFDTTESTEEGTGSQVVPDSSRKLIKRMDMSVETLEFDQFTSFLENRVTSMGGYIESSNMSKNSYQFKRPKYVYYTIRIPKEKLDEFAAIIGENANVVNTSHSTEDVTIAYYDTESRKKALVIQQERLLALLEKAENIEDIIQLEARLSDVTYEMESQSTILRNYDNLVEYSTLTLNVNEVERVSQAEPESIFDKMANGLSDTLYNMKIGFENLVVYAVVNLPYLLLIAAIVIGILLMFRRKHKKARMRAQMKENAAKMNISATDAAVEQKKEEQ